VDSGWTARLRSTWASLSGGLYNWHAYPTRFRSPSAASCALSLGEFLATDVRAEPAPSEFDAAVREALRGLVQETLNRHQVARSDVDDPPLHDRSARPGSGVGSHQPGRGPDSRAGGSGPLVVMAVIDGSWRCRRFGLDSRA
jgi:hypothetical protein